jgi:hypothetical protein
MTHFPDQITPLYILQSTMQAEWLEGDKKEAIKIALAIAPYFHSKPGTSKSKEDLSHEPEIRQLSDAEINRRIADVRARINAPDTPTGESARMG